MFSSNLLSASDTSFKSNRLQPNNIIQHTNTNNANIILHTMVSEIISSVCSDAINNNKTQSTALVDFCIKELTLIKQILEEGKGKYQGALNAAKFLINNHSNEFTPSLYSEEHLNNLMALFSSQPRTFRVNMNRTGAKYIAILVKTINTVEKYNHTRFNEKDLEIYSHFKKYLDHDVRFGYIRNVDVQFTKCSSTENAKNFNLVIQLGRPGGTMKDLHTVEFKEKISHRDPTLLEQDLEESFKILDPTQYHSQKNIVALDLGGRLIFPDKITANMHDKSIARKAVIEALKKILHSGETIMHLDLSNNNLTQEELNDLFAKYNCKIYFLYLNNNSFVHNLPMELTKRKLYHLNIKGTAIKSNSRILKILKEKDTVVIDNVPSGGRSYQSLEAVAENIKNYIKNAINVIDLSDKLEIFTSNNSNTTAENKEKPRLYNEILTVLSETLPNKKLTILNLSNIGLTNQNLNHILNKKDIFIRELILSNNKNLNRLPDILGHILPLKHLVIKDIGPLLHGNEKTIDKLLNNGVNIYQTQPPIN